MTGLQVWVDAVTTIRFFDDLPKKLRKNLDRAMDRIGFRLERVIKTEKLSGQALNVRTGNLRRSIFHRVGFARDDAFVVVGADLNKARYARIQELGGTIRPVRSANLAIPIGEARTRNGVARFSARDLIAAPGTYGYVGTFTRNHVIFGRRASGQIYPLFVLKPQVTIRAVGYLSNTLTENRRSIVEEVEEAMRDATVS